MLKIGLTGGIACGKSTVANLFAEQGVPVIDADQIAHALVAKNQPALIAIQRHFGHSVINADGSLNRAALSDIIFNDRIQKIHLENILHPLIYDNIQRQVNNLTSLYCVLAIPLLFETNQCAFVDRILVVDCPIELQINRIKARDQHHESKINLILNSQVTRETRLAKADDLINNSNDLGSVAQQVIKLHNLYIALAARNI